MDIQELASEQIDKLQTNPTPEQVAISTAVALWQIVKTLDRMENAMPHQSEV